MLDDEIRHVEKRISKIRNVIPVLKNVIDKANRSLDIIIKAESISNTQILAGERIDRGKLQGMHITCNNIINEASKLIEACYHEISSLTDHLNYLIDLRNSEEY